MKLFCKTHGVYFSRVGADSVGKMAELHSKGYDGCYFQWVEEPVTGH